MEYAIISKNGTRDYNEDSYVALKSNKGALFVVADGLGGHGKGEVASGIVSKTFEAAFNSDEKLSENFIKDNIQKAQNEIINEQKINHEQSKMKTTCVALVTYGDICKIGHIGDSRAYVFYKNKVHFRTYDHSVPQMLVYAKDIKEKDIRKHPDRNKLLRVLGDECSSPRYEIAEDVSMSKCQAFLLCSDGFWELCDEKKMCSYLKKSKSVQEWLHMMTEEVEKNGLNSDMDNFTAVAVIV